MVKGASERYFYFIPSITLDIRVHKNLEQHPSIYISILFTVLIFIQLQDDEYLFPQLFHLQLWGYQNSGLFSSNNSCTHIIKKYYKSVNFYLF